MLGITLNQLLTLSQGILFENMLKLFDNANGKPIDPPICMCRKLSNNHSLTSVKGKVVGNKQVLHEDGGSSIMCEMLYARIYKTSISSRRGYVTHCTIPAPS